jgi:hypothetical protein
MNNVIGDQFFIKLFTGSQTDVFDSPVGGIAIYLGIAVSLLLMADFSSILPHFFRTSDSMDLPSLSAVIWLTRSKKKRSPFA